MPEIPQGIVLKRHRDLQGRSNLIWLRRALVLLVALIPLLALLNVFGQRPTTSKASVPEATMSVYAPTHLRGGLIYEARFHITAHQEIKNAVLVLSSGWLEGMTLNTIAPNPIGEASTNGKLTLTLGHIPAHRSFLLFLQFQVNPTNVGHRPRTAALLDGTTPLAKVHQEVTVYP